MNDELDWTGWKFNMQETKSSTVSQVRTKLMESEVFENTSLGFQKMTMAMINSHDNQQYIIKAVTNDSVLAREDFTLLDKIANARTWLPEESAKELSMEEIQKEADNYHHVMTVLTSNLILNQENAVDIVSSVLACKTSNQACQGVDAIYHKLEEMNPTSSLNDMVSEATAPQVQPENNGFSK